jgi:hypothetical protein
MRKIKAVVKEISNYFFWRKIIKRNRNKPEWNKYKLREGWFGVVYTVVNLPAEVYEAEEQYHRAYVIEELAPLHHYFMSLNAGEIIVPEITKIDPKKLSLEEDERIDAYLVTYSARFQDFTFWWATKTLFFLSLAIYLCARFWDHLVALKNYLLSFV